MMPFIAMRHPAPVNSARADQKPGAAAAAAEQHAEDGERSDDAASAPRPPAARRHTDRAGGRAQADGRDQGAVAVGIEAEHVAGEHRHHGQEGRAEHAEAAIMVTIARGQGLPKM